MRTIHDLVQINKDPRSGWGASVPDLPGCVATARTLDAAVQRIRKAIEMHLEGILDDGAKPPRPRLRAILPRSTSNEVDFYATVGVSTRVA